MTKDEIIICTNLGKCRYLPATFEKRFAANMSSLAQTNPEAELSEKQKEQLYRQLKRYRRQIPKIFEKLYKEYKA